MKEALTLALDLAIMHHSDDGYAELRSKVRQLAKEALAPTSTQCEVQPEQEPVYLVEDDFGLFRVTNKEDYIYWNGTGRHKTFVANTAPPKRPWVELTDEEIETCRERAFSTNNPYCPVDKKSMWKAYQYLEAKLKELNT